MIALWKIPIRQEAVELLAVERLDPDGEWTAVEQLHRQAVELLAGLDRLGLFQAGAHLAMAIEAMRQRHPKLSPAD